MTAYFCQVDINTAARSGVIRFDLGAGLHLRLDERRIADREVDRRLSVALTGATVSEQVEAILVRGSVAGTPLDAELEPAPDLRCTHTWDGLIDGAPTSGSLPVELSIGRHLTKRFPFPARTSWWDRRIALGTHDARNLGLGGLVPLVTHHLEPDAGVLWLGTGRRITGVEPRAAGPDGSLLRVDVGNLRHIFDAAGRLRSTADRSKGQTRTTSQNDEAGRLDGWSVRPGDQYRVERSSAGQVVVHGPAGNWAAIELDDEGRAATVTTASGAAATIGYDQGLIAEVRAGDDVNTLEHGADGALLSWKRSNGQRVDLSEDVGARSRRTTMLTAGGREQTTLVEQLADGSTRRTKHCCGAAAPTVVTTSAIGSRSESPDGTVTTRTESSTTSRSGETTYERTVMQTPSGRVSTRRTTRRVDADGVNEVIEIDGRPWTRSLDRASRTVSTSTPEGRTSAYRLTPDAGLQVRSPGGPEVTTQMVDGRPVRTTVGEAVTEFERDEYGRVSAVVVNGVRRGITHDVAGRVVAQELSGGWLQASYDASSRLAEVTTPAGGTIRYERAADGLVTAMHVLAGERPVRTVRYDYDPDRTLVSETTDGGSTVRRTLDAAGRVSAIAAGEVDIEMEYDAAGRAIRVVGGGVTVERGYDGADLVSETSSGGIEGAVALRLDPSGLEIERSIDGVALPIERDGDGLPVVVGPVRVIRGETDGFVRQILAGSSVSDYSRDASGDIVTHTTTVGGEVVFAEELTRDRDGRVIAVAESGRAGSRTLGYRYDEAGRLVEATVDGAVVLSVSFDVNGNIVERSTTAGVATATYDEADLLVSDDGTPASHGPGADLARLGDRSFGYDGLGRLRSVVDANGADVEHTHDGLGRRVDWRADGSPYLSVLWSGMSVAAYHDDEGRRHRCVNTGVAEAPEIILAPERTMRLITDHRGSVRQVVDAESGETLQVLDYDAFGRRVLDTEPGCQPFGFTGALHDPYTGLVHLRARDLDPSLGRFLSPDPIGINGGQANLYQYAAGDPVNRTDPLGTQSSGGGVQVCTAPFMGSRPASVDHVFIKTDNWSRGATYGPDAQGAERIMQEWVDEKTHHNGSDRPKKDAECQPVENVDEECLNAYTQPGTSTGPYAVGLRVPTPLNPVPIEPNMCYTEVWDALDACSGDGGWEYSEDIIDRSRGDGPGLFEAIARVAREVSNLPETVWNWATH